MPKPLTPPPIENILSVTQAAERAGLSIVHMRRLLRTGVILGWKLGEGWFTTDQAVDAHMNSERKPGPNRKRRSHKVES